MSDKMDFTVNSELAVRQSSIPGLLDIGLVVHGDNRGYFKENYQAAKLKELGLPADFEPVQNNISFNAERGVTRGIHAEPWDKFISVAQGEVFAAIVDLRAGSATFGVVETFRLDAGRAIFVPRGCGNSFQTLTNNVTYTYLVNEHWSPEASYTMLNLADPTVAIEWPISLEEATISDKDQAHPLLADLTPMEV
ncbi:MAG: dTDP-4-dehydrorhamnose 3,5-epimerase [Candidatus Saccharimonadales bacterium]